jgi:hypothetical protein
MGVCHENHSQAPYDRAVRSACRRVRQLQRLGQCWWFVKDSDDYSIGGDPGLRTRMPVGGFGSWNPAFGPASDVSLLQRAADGDLHTTVGEP